MIDQLSRVEFSLPRHFVLRWLLSYLLPALLWVLLLVLVRSIKTPMLSLFDLALIVEFWIMVGAAQAYLLKGFVRQGWAWGLLTAIGGTMALLSVMFSPRGSFFIFLQPSALRVIGADGPWLVVAGLLAGAILGLCQICILRLRWSLRLCWLVGSSVGAAAAFFAADAVFELLFWETALDLLVTGREDSIGLIRAPTRILLGSLVFALVTGIVGRWLLSRQHRRSQAEMLMQFD